MSMGLPFLPRGPDNEAFAKALYEGMFTGSCERIHWIIFGYGHTRCGRMGDTLLHGIKSNRLHDFKYAQQVMTEMNTPFKLATFGWRVGSSGRWGGVGIS